MSERGSYYGLWRGIVRDNDDSAQPNPYRACLRVYVPQVYGPDIKDDQLPWAEPCFPLGGGQLGAGDQKVPYGFIAIPPVGASVWIEFEQGDTTKPVWLGCWYGEKDAQPEMPSEAVDGYPDTILLRDPTSADGLYIRFRRGSRLEIVSVKDKTQIVLKSDGALEISAKDNTITISSNSKEVRLVSGTGANAQSLELDVANSRVRIQGVTLELFGSELKLRARGDPDPVSGLADQSTLTIAPTNVHLSTKQSSGFERHGL